VFVPDPTLPVGARRTNTKHGKDVVKCVNKSLMAGLLLFLFLIHARKVMQLLVVTMLSRVGRPRIMSRAVMRKSG